MADGDPVIQGSPGILSNTTQTPTGLRNAGGPDGTGLYLFAGATDDALYAVAQDGAGVRAFSYRGTGVEGAAVPPFGRAGVAGRSLDAVGVSGEDVGSGVGVHGGSRFSAGVWASGGPAGAVGEASAEDGFGLYGINRNGTRTNGVGVLGFARTGVWGQGIVGAIGSSGVPFGIGVEGDAAGDGGIGVFGAVTAERGIGVYATAPSAAAAALEVNGRAVFSSAGRLVVPAGAAAATQAATLAATSIVLAVLQDDRPGVAVRAAVPDAAAGAFTVHLTQAVGADTAVGWFVIG